MLGTIAVLLSGLPNISAAENACCGALENAGLAHVLYPESAAYADRTISYWSVSARLSPDCIVQPTSTSDVAKVVKTLVGDASCTTTKFAVRSGGHTTWAGSNNIDNGITIDMGLMKTVTLDKDTSIASIQPGGRWMDVYGALDPEGWTVPGGRAGSVGVAGFLTGGGNSFYTGRVGFACDNVKNFEIVTARGQVNFSTIADQKATNKVLSEVINANAAENPDLWQALKGGSGGNFGIITRFDMFAFPTGNLWGGTATYNKSTSAEHVAAYVKWTDNVSNYIDGSSILIWMYLPTVADIIILAAYEDTQGNVAPSGFDDFMAIPRMADTLRVDSHKALTDELEQATGYRDIWFTFTMNNDAEISTKILELNQAFVDEWKANNDPDFITQCLFQAIPTVFSKHSVERGGNVMGLDKVDRNAIMILFNIAVKTAEEEARARPLLHKYGERMQAFAASKNGLVEWQYLNYADAYQDPLASYGAENLEKIRAAARKYDPESVFQNKAPGGFKISKAGAAAGSGVDASTLFGEVGGDFKMVGNLSDA